MATLFKLLGIVVNVAVIEIFLIYSSKKADRNS